MPNNIKTETSEYTCAGFFVRLSAYIIDLIILFFVTLIIRLAGIFPFFNKEILFTFSLKDITMYLCHVSYFIIFTYMTSATPGKRIMNLMVISDDTNGRLNLKDIIFRETIGKYLSAVIFNVGYILIGLDHEKRGLHDMLSDTHVVYAAKIKSCANNTYRSTNTDYHLVESNDNNIHDIKYDDII